MKALVFLLLSASCTFAGEKEVENPFLVADSIVEDASLTSDETVLYFYFPQSVKVSSAILLYTIDGGEEKSFYPLPDKPLEIKTTQGEHRFQFYYMVGNYAEKYAMTSLEGGHRAYYSVYFRSAGATDMVEKPVIYLYPEQQQEVSVKVQPNGGVFAFTYPPYNNGWKVTAHPNGQLELDSATYNYLFWEAELPRSTAPTYMYDVAGSRVTEELGHILQSIGMNGRETADFITYWAPRMQQHRYVRMGFLVNEECDELATLDITPTPDHVYRVYVFWYAITEPAANYQYSPKLPAINRDGFTVLEWGGMELQSP